MPKKKTLTLTAKVVEDHIYVLNAVNRHGQTIMVAADSTEAESEASRDTFVEENKDNRYWLTDGEIKTEIVKKKVGFEAVK